MPRRNQRKPSEYAPLDLTPPRVRTPPPSPYAPGEQRRGFIPQAERERDRAARQRWARTNRGIDWSTCLVPGCGAALTIIDAFSKGFSAHDPDRGLPLCDHHAIIVWRSVQQVSHLPVVIEATYKVQSTLAEKYQAEEAEAQRAFMAREDGDIYFVRLNGMVKAGWTRDLPKRLKQYGASVEVLCHYPATRDDETHLHRQLKPALARGREWYEDGPVVQMFIEQALEKYGPPTASARWTEPKEIIGRRRRAS